jgi:hypothetical protein
VTDAQRQASITRHSRFLTPSERQVFEPTEAERLAIDRSVLLAKQSWRMGSAARRVGRPSGTELRRRPVNARWHRFALNEALKLVAGFALIVLIVGGVVSCVLQPFGAL